MNLRRLTAKVFAFFILLFANFNSAAAQINSSIYQLPAGTIIRVRMDNEISSKFSGVNDTFTATVAAPVMSREIVVLPIGTILEGRITKARRASAGGKSGDLMISFEKLQLTTGEKRAIEGVLARNLKADSSRTAMLLTILGGATLGGVFGGVFNAKTGALIGAGIGAGAGIGIASLRKGKDIGIKADQEFEIKLTKNVTLPVRDY